MTLTPEQRRADRAIIDNARRRLVEWDRSAGIRFAEVAVLRWPAALDALDAAERENERMREVLRRVTVPSPEVARLRALLARVPHLVLNPSAKLPIAVEHHDATLEARAECARLGGACAMDAGKEAPR